WRRTAARKEAENFRADRTHARVATLEIRGVRGERKHQWQPRQYGLHDAETCVRIRHADVDVESVDSLPPRGWSGVRDEVAVAILRRDLELRGDRRRMRACSSDPKTVLLSNVLGVHSQGFELVDGGFWRAADIARQLHNRRVQLGLDMPGKAGCLRARHQDLDARRQLERLGVEDHHLFL